MDNTDHNLLRFITAGSVDDGKSTLIGRLLYDSQAILTDQTQALTHACHKRVAAGEEIDFSLLTDGLEAEREQGITIDVAYRYFRSPKRRFIIADTPGHEQYTRNMVTGASTADAAVVLIDATRLDINTQPVHLLSQTIRHSAVIRLLGLKHVIVAVNKMDLVDYNQTVFDAICEAYHTLADTLGLDSIQYVPVSALRGDNIVHQSEAMSWYHGQPLLNLLESLPANDHLRTEASALRFPVQLVARQDGFQADDFRGYLGLIEAGSVSVGQRIRVLPGGHETTIAALFGPNGDQQQASAGETITLQLTEDIDVSRGDMFVDANSPISPNKQLYADLCWFDEEPLNLARKYLLKHTTHSVYAKISNVERVFDVQTLSQATGHNEIKLNDIGSVNISLQKPVTGDSYDSNPSTGAFILIDPVSNHTIAAGMIRSSVNGFEKPDDFSI